MTLPDMPGTVAVTVHNSDVPTFKLVAERGAPIADPTTDRSFTLRGEQSVMRGGLATCKTVKLM